MKSNKSNSSFDIMKFFKPALIVMLVLVVVAGVIVGIFGFNKGIDFSGGTQLVVQFEHSNIDIEDSKDFETASNGIRKILTENGVEIESFQVQGEFNTQTFVVTFKNTDGKTLQDVRVAINKKFNASEAFAAVKDDENKCVEFLGDGFDITRQTTEINATQNSKTWFIVSACLLFALVLAVVYACIRFKTLGGVVMTISGIVDVLLTLCFVGLARVEVNAYIFAVTAMVLCLSVYATADLLFAINEKGKDPTLKIKSNTELASVAVDSLWKKNQIVYIMALIISLFIGILTVQNVLHVALVCIAGIAVVYATHLFVVPALWSALAKQRHYVLSHNVPAKVEEDVDIEIEEE